MSDLSKEARAGAKSKLARMLADPTHPVDGDASRYTPPGPELGMIQTGERPVTRARFRTGGSVTGAKTTARADRKPRASGGMTATQYLNRDVREANESRAGLKHDGGFARGGAANDGRARARKFMGGPMAGTASPYVSSMGGMGGGAAPAQRAMMPGQAAGGARPFKDGGKAEHGASCKCAKCSGGRVARASGGGNWIAGATKNKGALHKELGVAEGKKIPAKKLEKAAHSENPLEAKRANLAETLKKMPHKAAGGSLDGTLQGMRPKGGRLARKAGGSAKKGGMNVNIIIAPPKPQMAMPPPGAMPPRGPQGIPAPPPQAMGPPPGAMPPPGAGAPPPMGAPPMMGRKSGGRAGYPIKDGAGGGKGRLEKIRAYG